MKPPSTGPDFICIGAHKTGTTWLYETLKRHPEVYLPPVKEIRYFWERYSWPHQQVIGRFTGRTWLNSWYRATLKTKAKHYLRHIIQLPRRRHDLIWDIRFFFLPHTDRWYASLFTHARPPRKGGDISPQYFSLPEKVVCRIHSLYPCARIIILLRNPVDRVWSWAKMVLCKNTNKTPDQVSDEEFYEFFDSIYELVPSYMAVVNKWKCHFSDQQVFVGFYDQLLESPFDLYREISQFIGIDVEKTPQQVVDMLSEQHNVGLKYDVPRRYAIYLTQQYEACVEEVCQSYRPFPQRWRTQFSDLLSTDQHNSGS